VNEARTSVKKIGSFTGGATHEGVFFSRNSEINASSGYHTGLGIKNYMTSSPPVNLVNRPLIFT
jgi:hypothetical protein